MALSIIEEAAGRTIEIPAVEFVEKLQTAVEAIAAAHMRSIIAEEIRKILRAGVSGTADEILLALLKRGLESSKEKL